MAVGGVATLLEPIGISVFKVDVEVILPLGIAKQFHLIISCRIIDIFEFFPIQTNYFGCIRLSIKIQALLVYAIQLIFYNSNTMTQQSRTFRHDENHDHKRFKRSAAEQTMQSLKKSELKLRSEEQANKITRYFNIKAASPTSKQDKRPSLRTEEENKVQQLQEKLKEKEKLIQQLKEKRQLEEERCNYWSFQTRQLKNKTGPILAKTMLALAENKREQRRQRDHKMGHFTDGMRIFVEGEHITTIKSAICQKEALILKLQGFVKSKLNNQDHVRAMSSLQFNQKELNELKKQLQHRQKEVAMYKDMVKLYEKQARSFYSKAGWPLVYQRYQTLELLGSGGFGQVYKCYDLENNKIVALKRVYFSGIRDQSERKQFLKHVTREAEIQKNLSHPNIARFENVVEINKEQNLLVFELQYCTGPQLGTYLRKHSCLEEREAKLIMKQLFSALEYLSKLKERIIHYDLKPSNIMFDNGVVKILDFGLSKIMHGEQTRMDLTSQGVGTYWYLPPETFEDFNPQISAKVDVWSLGVIFFELLYGRKPFGHGIPQQQIYNSGIILRAYKVQFPSDTPRKFRVSDGAKQFISGCLKYRQQQRFNAAEASSHSYFSK